jgi:rhodanese-related sulfurtransferase
VKAGYEDVNVMADGIKGWVQAGQPTSPLNSTEGRAAS